MKLNLILSNDIEKYIHSVRGNRSCAAYISHLLKSLYDESTKKEIMMLNDTNNEKGNNNNVRRKTN